MLDQEARATYIIEGAGILRGDIKRPAERAERAPVQTVAVSCAEHVWSGSVDGGMDHEGCCVEHAVGSAVNHLAGVVDLNQIGCLDQGERSAEGVHPESRWIHGVAKSDMTSDTYTITPLVSRFRTLMEDLCHPYPHRIHSFQKSGTQQRVGP